MKFTRTLKPSFISALNELYRDQESWWRKIADDDDVFILIRNNEIRAQVNGGLLLHIRQGSGGRLICQTHEEFLSLRNQKEPYVILDDTSTSPIRRVEGLRGFSKHYLKIKRRINIFTGNERKAVQYLANKVTQVVDLEIGFEGELKKDAKKKSVPRIDMAAITNDGLLVFFEAKLFDNKEIRSKRTPKVVGQLEKYEKFLEQYGSDILAGYRNQLELYTKLNGKFFKKRIRKIKNLRVYPHARLIITGFDASQRDHLLPIILEGVEKGTGWAKDSKDLIATGNHKSLAKSNRLFLGLK